MRAEQWDRLKSVLADALERPAGQRRSWLQDVCAGDPELGTEAEALLDAYESDLDFLGSPAEIDPGDVAEALDIGSPIAGMSPGTILGDGRYRILGEAGRGGMGVVYVAEDLRLPRRVALKSVSDHLRNDPLRLERLRREAWAAAKISHPAVATVHAFEDLGGRPFIVSEYVRGVPLRHELAVGPIPTARAFRIATEIARALAAAHEQGVVHRDLKPDNVIVNDDAVKVVDFGIAQLARDESEGLTQEGVLLGTPAYMAPEQIKGGPVDGRADIFSFGILLAEMLTGSHPLRLGSSVSHATPPSVGARLEAAGGSIPRPFGPIVTRCLQLLPSERYASARELLRDLESVGTRQADGSSPAGARWWWQFHQAAVVVVYALIAVLAWKAKADLVRLDPRLDGIFSIVLLASVIVSASLRLNLWFTSHYFPSQLARVRETRRRWIIGVDVVFIGSIVTAALLILFGLGARQLSFALLACGIGATVALTLIEPVTEHAAFDA